MELLLIATIVLIALSVYLAVVALGEPSERLLETLGQIGAYGYASADDELIERGSHLRAWIDRFAMRLGEPAANRLTGLQLGEIQRELVAAGLFDLSVRKFLGYRLMVTVALPVSMVARLTIR